MTRLFLLLILAGSVTWSCQSGGMSETEAANTILAENILRDVKVLSADEMEGRAPGTAGEEKAAAYIARRFEENGLQTVDGSYYQTFNMVGSRKIAEKSSLTIRRGNTKLDYVSDETLTYWSTSPEKVVDIKNAPILFVGYGVQAPEYGWDDIKGADVKGKVLLFLNNDPPVTENGKALFKGEARTYYGRWTYKFEQAMRLGAAGAIMIHTTPSASYPFSVIGHSGAKEKFALDLPGSGYQVDLLAWIDQATSEKIAKSMGSTLQGLFEMAARRDFKPRDTGYTLSAHIESAKRVIETKNVLGILPGSDPRLRDQVIVFSAHYDHLGKNSDPRAEDQVYNGAWDNALGTAALINMAGAFGKLKDKPARSILFLACAAEESGSLGSRWFVAKPPFARNKIVADFNIDMPQIFGLTRDLAAIGVEMNSLGTALKEVAAQTMVPAADGGEQPLKITGDANPNAGSFYRSDQINFAKAGIPALYINPGRDFVQPPKADPKAYKTNHYHQLSDSVTAVWDLSGCQRDMRVLFRTALKVAGNPDQPVWVKGNEFEAKWQELYGKK